MPVGRMLRLKSYLASVTGPSNAINVHVHQHIKVNGNYCKDKYQHPLTKISKHTHLASLDLADQRHEHGTAWQIINHFAGDINKTNPSKVRSFWDRTKEWFYPKNKEQRKEGETTLILFSITGMLT